MSRRRIFNAGPTALPLPVLQRAQADLLDYQGQGLSVMEMSHRSPGFQAIFDESVAALTEVLSIPDTHEVLFLQGGASLQFAMLAYNLGDGGAYLNTGAWSTKALKEANILGKGSEIWSSADTGFNAVPQPDEALNLPSDTTYLHYTSNNTIYGTQYSAPPKVDVPLVCDMSSDIMSRPVDIGAHDFIYAGAQKNAGPSGVTIIIARKEILHGAPKREGVPTMLRYDTHAKKGSMFNTPNTFGIYLIGLVARWVLDQGGVEAMARLNTQKSSLLYDIFDDRADIFAGHAQRHSRSQMNVTFTMRDDSATPALLAAAADRGIIGLKGHRSVGGLRASIYNAVPLEDVEVLAELLRSV
ncbi:MAG: 3-phosphoserine/phosphohydroxythreonine transaminase [Bradymonadia bacterium]